jgi:hypothetical protein
MQTAQLFNQSMAGSQIKVIGIRQDDLSVDGVKIFRRHRFHGGIGANRHKYRGLYIAMFSF